MSIYLPKTYNKTVSSAGTRLQVSTTTQSYRLAIIQANSTNSGNIFIGGSTVSSTVYGIKLVAGASIAIGSSGNDPTFDFINLYADTSNSGDGFSILYF